MFEREEFIQVGKEEFWEFVKNNTTTFIKGEWFHSEYYLDKNNNKVAYIETSSYGAPTIYEIKK